MTHALLVAPAGHGVGLTTVCLGLVRALDRRGVRVGFCKPLAQPGSGGGPDTSLALVRLGAAVTAPEPLAAERVRALLSAGDDQVVMEEAVARYQQAAQRNDVVIIEGLVPQPGMVHAMRVNHLLAKALDAEVLLVATPGSDTPAQVAGAAAIAARGFGLAEGRQPAVVVNRAAADTANALRNAIAAEHLRPAGVIPPRPELSSPRTSDLARALGATVLRPGDQARRRIRSISLCAMAAANATESFTPGALVVTPSDRTDIIMAAALAALNGVPLAGLLLTDHAWPDPRVLTLCEGALATGLPVLALPEPTYAVAVRLNNLHLEVPTDDADRVNLVMDAVAEQLDAGWLEALAKAPGEPRLSPPAFRYRLMESARAAGKRIVLPEGDEPRTVRAAVIAHQRGLARLALLGDPAKVRAVAAREGVVLPDAVEIIDPAEAIERYVGPLVEARRHKGMTEVVARNELSDTIMLGTMMMHLGEADGLVSGAVHTTAHTIRPALQIIKTAPGSSLVSSVFFMCLPDQVLVFGDCAVNPDPTAEQLADIAIQSADSAAAFGIPPRVAMLSYSTGASGAGADVEKVVKATALAKERRPDLLIDGPLQYDAAIMPEVARQKAPKSPVAGKATVFIFPDLNTGNVTYKAVQRAANVVSMGPMLQGMAKPVNDLSRGCLVEDIVFTIALTAIQAQQAAGRQTTTAAAG
jgi:phosphate acetyltransferase